MPKLEDAYSRKAGTPIDVDGEFYGRLAGQTDGRTLVDKFVVPVRSR